jgi:hypothetical protein
MTTQASLSPSNSHPLSRSSLAGRLGALKAHGAAWIETCADYYDAASIYDQLSRLSDAELHRRGLSRTTLARQICEASGPLMGR